MSEWWAIYWPFICFMALYGGVVGYLAAPLSHAARHRGPTRKERTAQRLAGRVSVPGEDLAHQLPSGCTRIADPKEPALCGAAPPYYGWDDAWDSAMAPYLPDCADCGALT